VGAVLADAKTKQHCRAETALLSIWNDLPQEFTDMAILSFRKRSTSILCYCSWQTLRTLSLNTQRAAWHSLLKRFKCLRKSCAKFDSLFRRLTEYSGRDCNFTWKSEL